MTFSCATLYRRVAVVALGVTATSLIVACGGDTLPAEPTVTAAAGQSLSTSTVTPPDGTASVTATESKSFAVGNGSKATFTVTEKLTDLPAPNDAVLTSSAVTGEVRLDGQPFVVSIDLHQLKSDQSRRDQYVRNNLFPRQAVTTVSFNGIGDADIPGAFWDGDTVTTNVTGTVNVNGVDAPISFEIEARNDGDVVYVLGRADFTWADFGMRAPVSNLFHVYDDVHVEVLLAANPA